VTDVCDNSASAWAYNILISFRQGHGQPYMITRAFYCHQQG